MTGKAPSPYYRHSGRVSVLGLILTLALLVASCWIAGIFAGAFRLFSTYFIDIGLLGLLVTGSVAGFLGGWSARLGRVRNEMLLRVLATILAGALAAFSWFMFLSFLQVYELPSGMAEGVWFPWEDWGRNLEVLKAYSTDADRPAQSIFVMWAIARLTGLIAEVEFRHVTGFWLYLLWAAEMWALVGATFVIFMQTAGTRGFVFCETCQRPTKTIWRSELLKPLPERETAELVKRLENGEFAGLLDVPVHDGPMRDSIYRQFALRRCPKCREFHTVDLHDVKAHWRDGDWDLIPDPDRADIKNLLIPPEWAERIKARYAPAANL